MSKRSYFPNQKLIDDKLPFNLEITSGLTVYVRAGESGQMIKADTIFLKRKKWIVVNHAGFIVTIKGYDNKEKKFIYDIKQEVVE